MTTLLKQIVPTVLASHDGSSSVPGSAVAGSNDLTILWVVAGVFIGSIVLVMIIAYFSKS